MVGKLKLLAGMGAAVVGGAIGDLLYAQRDAEHPNGVVVVALTPAQIAPCFLIVALAARVTQGNLLAMLGSGLLAGIGTSLAYGAEAKAAMVGKMRKKLAFDFVILAYIQPCPISSGAEYRLLLARICTHLAEIV